MSIEGYIDYKRREFCKDIQCHVQRIMDKQDPDSDDYEQVRTICKTGCIHTTYEFHHWLIKKEYLIIRPDNK